jgi:hypothetical protein
MIHSAAANLCLEVVKFLYETYPELISILDEGERSLLHLATNDIISDIADVIGKVQYLCDQCPALIHLKDIEGNTALHNLLKSRVRLDFECVKVLCTPSNII